MTSYSQPTGHTTNPLQPTASGPHVPQGLDVGAPGHTPVPQHADHQPAGTGYNTMSGDNTTSHLHKGEITGRGSDAYVPPAGYNSNTASANTTETSTYGKPATFGNQDETFTGSGAGYNSGTTGHHTGVPSTFDNKDDNFAGRNTGYGTGANTTGPSTFDHASTHGRGDNLTGVAGVGHGGTHTTTASGAGYGITQTTMTGHDQSYTNTGGETVFDITAPDNKTIIVSSESGPGYTMATTFENHRELFTVRRGTPNMPAGAGETSDIATGTTDDTDESTGEPFVAQLEPHQLRSTKFSWKGGPQMKLKDWLGGRGTAVYTVREGDKVYEWRKSFQGHSNKFELFTTDQPDTRLAWVEKVTATEADKKEHEHMRPPLPAHPATAKMWVTSAVLPFVDMVVVSFLLVDRETRGGPIQS